MMADGAYVHWKFLILKRDEPSDVDNLKLHVVWATGASLGNQALFRGVAMA